MVSPGGIDGQTKEKTVWCRSTGLNDKAKEKNCIILVQTHGMDESWEIG